jgi:mannose-6-phosphate isomerase-like protein (cupin superfamily)
MDRLPVDLAEAECVRLGTDEITILTTSAQTGGDLFAVQIRMLPGGGPPVMHRHDPSEIYYVLAGKFSFYIAGATGVRRVIATTGDVVPLAGGTPHTIRNESAADAVAFVVHAPGAPMEAFSRAVAAAAADGDPSMDAVLGIAAQHGIEMLGPIPDLADDQSDSR